MACGCRHPAAGIPGYSGGTAAESHRIPCFSKRAARTRHIMGGAVCQCTQPHIPGWAVPHFGVSKVLINWRLVLSSGVKKLSTFSN